MQRRYKPDFCFNSSDIYKFSNPKKWGLTKKIALSITSDGGLQYTCAMIFLHYMWYVLLDIIENNVTFEFPLLGKDKAYLFVKAVDGEEFKKLYALGKFSDIDFIKTGFTGFQICFKWNTKNGWHEKWCYISWRLKNYFIAKINNGTKYDSTETVYCERYLDAIYNEFPQLSIKQLEKLVKYGLRMFYLYNKKGGDIYLRNYSYVAYFGRVFYSSLKFSYYRKIKLQIKYRVMYLLAHKPFTGKYYFGLKQEDFDKIKYKKGGHRRRKNFHFDRLYLFKIPEECECFGYKYIFEIDFKEDVGCMYRWDNATVRCPRMILKYNKITKKHEPVSNVEKEWKS